MPEARWMLVTYLDGRDPIKVRIGPKAEVMYERHFGVSLYNAKQDISAEHLYYLTWCALRSSLKEKLEFDDWLDLVEEVDGLPEGPDGRPLSVIQKEAESEESSNSAS